MLILTRQQKTAFENIVAEEEIARDEQFFSSFSTMFSTQSDNYIPFVHILTSYHLLLNPFPNDKFKTLPNWKG